MHKFYELLQPAQFTLPLITLWCLGTQLIAFIKNHCGTSEKLRPDFKTRSGITISVSIAALFYLLAMWRLAEPPVAVFDECYHSRTAMEYLNGQNPTEWTHPPLAKLCIAVSLKLWEADFDTRQGFYNPDHVFLLRNVVGWRHASVLFGSLSLLLLFALARSITNSVVVAASAEVLLALDGAFFVQSRVAMTNVFTVFFILLAALGAWRYHASDHSQTNRWWLILTGIGLGCALATRWSSAYAWGLILVFLALGELPQLRRDRLTARARTVGYFTIAFLLIPLVIYFASYIPFVLQGPGSWWNHLFSANAGGHGWGKVITQQADMWNYHTNLSESHTYGSPWWSWPLELRPAWYFFRTTADGRCAGIWCIGNVFQWWAVVPALVTAAYLAVRDRRKDFGFIAWLGLGLWLMWGIQPRSLTFQHYFLEAVPFGCLAVAWFGHRIWCLGGTGARRFVLGYGVLCTLWFAYYYPLLSALPVPQSYYRAHLWLGPIWI